MQFNPVVDRIIIGRVDIRMFRPKGRNAAESVSDEEGAFILSKYKADEYFFSNTNVDIIHN